MEPLTFEMALGMNQKAKEAFEALSEEEKHRFLEEGRKLRSREAQFDYVSRLAGWTDPHPPYQL